MQVGKLRVRHEAPRKRALGPIELCDLEQSGDERVPGSREPRCPLDRLFGQGNGVVGSVLCESHRREVVQRLGGAAPRGQYRLEIDGCEVEAPRPCPEICPIEPRGL